MAVTLAKLPVKDLRDVSAAFRRIADLIDNGQYAAPAVGIAILGYSDHDVRVYGYGDRASPLEISGWLARAQVHLASMPDPERKPQFPDPPAA